MKQKPGNQNIFLSAFDYSTKKLIMSVLQPTVSVPKTVADYKKVDMEVATKKIHELDQIESHTKTSEMLYSQSQQKLCVLISFKIPSLICNTK